MERIRKGDQVVVIAGKDRGARGRVLKVLRDRDRVIVEGVNSVKRHTKPTQKMPNGGILDKDMPIHVSNVMLLDTKSDKPTRIKFDQDKDGKKIRKAHKTGTVLEG
jgi:large subunit ribosomal protein L24